VSECKACSRPCIDAQLCRSCADQLTADLRALTGNAPPALLPKKAGEQRTIATSRGLLAELEDTLTRQARVGHRNGPRSSEQPLAFHLGASVDLESIRDTLAMWAGAIAQRRGVTVDAELDAAQLAHWLIRWAGEAAQHPDAGEMLGDVRSLVTAARRTIDLAPELRYVGPCDGCHQALYAGMHATTVTCGTEDCGLEYPIEKRRAWLLEQAVDQLRTARQLAYELPWIAGVTINAKTIGMWAARGKLTRYLPHPKDTRHATRFRVGEVIDTARGMAKQQANGAA